jgi:ankyrin repeat protein
MIASKNGHIDVVDVLLAGGADVNAEYLVSFHSCASSQDEEKL